ncbi:hypothetical protein AVEN_34853-1 [Araneus ventricosus]|uniref:Uncharacterized protein n=1 Tax=Araneus ventricosus TaxID=182803 RepID=A0A4Y2LYW4_ARAVE|nr:hypothetical protein AVEN_34853-1 [Araneus ventricosus]
MESDSEVSDIISTNTKRKQDIADSDIFQTVSNDTILYKIILLKSRCFCHKIANDVLYTSAGNYHRSENDVHGMSTEIVCRSTVSDRTASRIVIDIQPIF